MILTRCLCVFT